MDAVVRQAFALEPVSHAALDHEVDGGLFENPRANTFDDVILRAILDDEGVDACEM